jgi:hypothetical protein
VGDSIANRKTATEFRDIPLSVLQEQSLGRRITKTVSFPLADFEKAPA